MAAVVGIRAWPRPVVLTCATLLLAGCYYAAGRLGLSQQLTADGSVVTPIWPPTGLAVACLLLFGPWCVPGIALGALLVIVSLGAPGPGPRASWWATPPPPSAPGCCCARWGSG